MVDGKAWWALHMVHDLVGMECYMVWSGGHTMVYGMAWWT